MNFLTRYSLRFVLLILFERKLLSKLLGKSLLLLNTSTKPEPCSFLTSSFIVQKFSKVMKRENPSRAFFSKKQRKFNNNSTFRFTFKTGFYRHSCKWIHNMGFRSMVQRKLVFCYTLSGTKDFSV